MQGEIDSAGSGGRTRIESAKLPLFMGIRAYI